MNKRLPTLLVTGFGPFPGAPQNPSERLVAKLAKSDELPGVNIVTGLLPTHWRKLEPALDTLLARHEPDFCVHLGYSAASPGFCLETTAYNQTCAQPDVDGQTPSCEQIIGDQPLQITSRAPIETAQQRLSKAGFGAIISHDPGRYLCNMAYYLSLDRSRTSLFVHIPAIKTHADLVPQDHCGDHTLSLEDARRGLGLILHSLTKP